MEEVTRDEVNIPAGITGEGHKNSLKRATESFNPKVTVGRLKTSDSYTVRRSKKPARQHADPSLSQADFFLPPSCSASWKPHGDQERGPLHLSWIAELAS